MAKGASKASGGSAMSGSASGLPPVTKILPPPTPQQVAQGNILPQGGVPFSDFQSMSDDEKADVISDALKVGTPIFLDDSGMQRFAYFTGMSEKPTVVSDSQLDSISGKEIFRNVHDVYDRNTDIGYTANDICKQISTGDYTMYSDSGGSFHGKAIYFASSFSDAKDYMDYSKPNRVMRAKITSGKTIDESTNNNNFARALSNGDKLAKACSRADSASQASLYALAKGYSVITDRYTGYNMVLNRSALTVSDTYKDPKNRGGW